MTKVFIAKGGDRTTRSSSNYVLLACIVLASVTFAISQSAATAVKLPLDREIESKHAVISKEETESVETGNESSPVPSATRSTPVDEGIERVPYAVLMANAERKIAERHAWLSTLHSEGSKFSELKGAAMWYMFQPVMPCLWYMEKVPSATIRHDGGVSTYLCRMRLPVDLFRATNCECSTQPHNHTTTQPHNFLP
jgi:hypothetical protein